MRITSRPFAPDASIVFGRSLKHGLRPIIPRSARNLKSRPLHAIQLIASIADTVDSAQSVAKEAVESVNQAAQTAAIAVATSAASAPPPVVNPNDQPGPFDFIADALESLLKVRTQHTS